MIADRPVRAGLARSGSDARRGSARAGFTLVEIMVSMAILAVGMTITMVVFIAAVKRANHTENMLKDTSELRYAADMISQAVRSASQPPTTNTASNSFGAAGTQLYIAPGTFGYLLVDEITWLDTAHTIKGTKSGQKNLKVDAYRSTATYTPFSSTSRPTGALATTDVGTYFLSSASVPSPTVSSLLSVGDTLSVPQTSYGPAQTATVNSVSNNSGTATVTVTNNFAYSIPQGTKISIQSAHTQMFAVVGGQLRFYPDSSVTTNYTVLASDISSTPLSDPSNKSSAPTVPFVISSTNTSYVSINLQMLPKGTPAGRTLQGVLTTAYSRTNPASP